MDLLHFVIPGLFHPHFRGVTQNQVEIEAPHLEWLLDRSKRHSTDSDCIESTLLHLFRVKATSDLPVAPINYFADFGVPPANWCMRADPVYMVPEGDGLVLAQTFGADDITREEALFVAEQFNQLYSDLDLTLKIAPNASHRWYIEFNSFPGIQTHPIFHVINRNVNPYLPFGDSDQKWHQLMNEMQMLLHSSEINEARNNAQKMPINSVWLWGEGQMPAVRSDNNWTSIYSRNAFASSLAKLSKTTLRLDEDAEVKELLENGANGRALWVMDTPEQYDDFDAWQSMVKQLEENFFGDLKEALQSKKLQLLTIDTGVGSEFHVTPQLLWRVWQRKKHFTDYLNTV